MSAGSAFGSAGPAGLQGEATELHVPLLESDEIHSDTGAAAGQEDAAVHEGDVEQGLVAGSDAEAGSNKSEEDVAVAAARATSQSGPGVYCLDLLRLLIFYWAIVADALLMKELYSQQHLVFAGVATGFTVGPHVFMSLLLIIRQGWLQAASQACGFILTLNPFESLTPIPQGVLGLFVISIGFIAYVLIAASGLIFVAYCVVCYLVTALLFSLLILDLAALVITVAPSKAIFKYTDLVYTENFKFSRLVLQAWLQSAPELVVIAVILYRNVGSGGPAVVINGTILLHALAAHLVNLWDKCLLFRSAAAAAGAGPGHHLLCMLQVKGSCRLSLPVLRDNLSRVLRGAGGGAAGAGLGSVVHISSAEDAPDNDSELAASMVPEYLTPTNGGLLSPGQLVALARGVLQRYGGPGVAELVLEITPDVMVGKLLSQVMGSIPNTSSVRLVNASVRGADAARLTAALLQCGSLRTLQLHQVIIDERGAVALMQLLDHTPTLQQLDLCRCKLRRRAPQALAQGLRLNRTLRQLNLAGCQGLDDAGGAALTSALACSKVLCGINLAFVKLGPAAVDSLVQALNSSSSLRVLAVSQEHLPVEGCHKLLAAISALRNPKAPPSLSCNLTLGTFPVEGLDRVQWLAVQDQEALIMDAWQGLAAVIEGSEGELNPQPGGLGFGAGVDAAGVAGALQLPGDGGSTSERGAGQAADETAPLLGAAAAGSSSSRRPPSLFVPHAPPTAFDVASPLPAAAAAGTGSSNMSAAWFGAGGSSSSSSGLGSTASSSPCSGAGTSAAAAAAAGCSSTADLACPMLVFVVTQEDVVNCMVKSPLLFPELDTLDLTGLGIGDEGAAGMARVLEQNPAVRRVVLTDNKIGEEGGASLGAALTLNDTLQVLDLSANELSETGVCVLAEATKRAAGLRQLRLLGNKIPFGLSTLRKLMEAEAASPHCHLVLVEEPQEVLDELNKAGETIHALRAAEFFKRQEQYRAARRQRLAARQQRLLRLEEQAATARAAEAAAAEAAGEDSAGDGSSSQEPDIEAPAAAAAAAVDPSTSDASSIAASAASAAADTTAAAGGSSSAEIPVLAEVPAAAAAAAAASGSSSAEIPVPASPLGSGSVRSASSLTADEDTCGICFDNCNHVAIKYCGHRLCVDCYRKVWELSGTGSSCPFCRARLEGYLYLDWPLEP
uniref:RING-type domain-containing protein n=1 Tax=Tetradesmus obliquus TaxID=3088 RepID=A0A383V493_TETOB